MVSQPADPRLQDAMSREPFRSLLREYLESLRQDELERMAHAPTTDVMRIVQGRAQVLKDIAALLR